VGLTVSVSRTFARLPPAVRGVLGRALVVFGVLAVVSGVLGLTPVDASAQSVAPVVRSAAMRVDVTGSDGSAEVEIDYVLSGTIATRAVAVALLGFDSSTVTDAVYCCWAGSEETIVLWPSTGSRRMASIPLPVVPAGADGPSTLRISYHVARAVTEKGGGVHGRIPVLSLDLPPLGGGADVFSTSLSLPAEWIMTEGFPTGFRPGDDGVPSVTPVVPSMVSFRARSDGRWRPGLPLLIDVLMSALILLVGFFGWRHLRRLSS